MVINFVFFISKINNILFLLKKVLLITDGNGYGKLPQNHSIKGGTWHKVQMFLINNNPTQNTNHLAIRSFSGFALDLSSISTDVTYQMRNLRSIVY